MKTPSSSTSASSNHSIPGGEDQSRGTTTATQGISVHVDPSYLEGHSNPYEGQFIFQYQIRIVNDSTETVTLRDRHWIIIDEDGEREDVKGEGVIGMQPTLKPGESFEYESYCPLGTRWGTMEGTYRFERESDSAMFVVDVARFFLVAPESTPNDAPARTR